MEIHMSSMLHVIFVAGKVTKSSQDQVLVSGFTNNNFPRHLAQQNGAFLHHW